MKLLTEDDLAQEFMVPVETIQRWRRRRGWPHVKLSRFDIRFTESQVQQIVIMHSEAQKKRTAEKGKKLPGQTARSAARGGAAK